MTGAMARMHSLNRREIAPVFVEVHRQLDRLRAQLGGLHQAHGRADAELPRRVGGGGDDAAADVVLQARKRLHRDEGARVAAGLRLGRGLEPGEGVVHRAAPAADHHRQALELRVAQQLDGRVERVHVEVGDAAGWCLHDG
jgi:hypothetical protein